MVPRATSSRAVRTTSPVAPGGSGTLSVRPGAAGTADLVRTPRPGVQRVLVRRDVEDVGVVPEDRLGAVAVMHVPVHDQDPLAAAVREAAATATLLTRQNPMARSGVA